MQEFIAKKGVTQCPAMHTPELALEHKRRADGFDALSPEEKRKKLYNTIPGRRGRKSIYTPEQRKERNRAYQRERWAKKKAERQAKENPHETA